MPTLAKSRGAIGKSGGPAVWLSRVIRLLLLWVLSLAGSARTARAQINVFKIGGQPLVLTGSIRTRNYGWDFFNPGVVNGVLYQHQYDYAANVVRLGLGYETHDVRFFGEMMNPLLLGIPDYAVAPAPQGALGLGANYYQPNRKRYGSSVFLKQAYVEVHGARKDLAVKGGRFEFSEGVDLMPTDPQLRWIVMNEIQQRLIGNFGWSDVMRSLDGGSVRYGGPSWNVTAVAAIPTQGVFDLNGMDEVRSVNVEYGALNAGPNGSWGNSVARTFFIHYYDGRDLTPVDNEPSMQAAANHFPIGIETLGADWVHELAVGPGAFDVTGWAAYQWGSWGRQSQRAFAYVGQLGYRFNRTAWEPWLRAEYTVGSGDHNPGDIVHHTFFQILPTPRPYALDPFYNMMNIRDAAADVILDPSERIKWRTTVHGLWLDSSRDLWYAGGGAFSNTLFGYVGHPSGGHNFLATVADTVITWKANQHLSFSLYFGHAFGGPVVKADFNGNHEENLAYVESDVSF